MKITVTDRHGSVHETLRQYAEEKAEKLERYFDQLQKIEIVFSSEGDRKTVEMIAVPKKSGKRIVGQVEKDDAFAAVDLLVDKMYNQLHKAKEKIHDKRKRSGRLPPPPAAAGAPVEPLPTYEDVVDKFGEQLDQRSS